jgi:hypothetical protein
MLTPKDLHDYQNKAYRDIVKRKVFCLTEDCGGGKTIIALSAFVILKRRNPKTKMLVVCSASGVGPTWGEEHKKWSHTKDLKVFALTGNPKQRAAMLKTDGDIYAISYNSLEWLVENNKTIDFNYVFADEADCLKGPSSKWRKHLIAAAPNAEYKILSSATPKAKEEDDYWGLCKYMDDGACLNASTVTEFRNQYCISFVFKNRIIYKMDKKKVGDLERRIKHLFRRYGPSSDIPVKKINVYSNLEPKSELIYKKLQEEQCVNSIIFDKQGRKDEDKSLDAMTLSNKLNQLSSGFLYIDENVRISPETLEKTTDLKKLVDQSRKRKTLWLFDDRIKALKKLLKVIKEKHGCPVVICYTFKAELEQLKKLLPGALTDTEPQFEQHWNADQCDYLLLQYSRSSKSLNLQKGSSHVMVMYSSTFRWVDDYQIVKRIARQGQKADRVYAYRLFIRGTVDDVKTKRLDERFKGHTRFQKQIIKQTKKG